MLKHKALILVMQKVSHLCPLNQELRSNLVCLPCFLIVKHSQTLVDKAYSDHYHSSDVHFPISPLVVSPFSKPISNSESSEVRSLHLASWSES